MVRRQDNPKQTRSRTRFYQNHRTTFSSSAQPIHTRYTHLIFHRNVRRPLINWRVGFVAEVMKRERLQDSSAEHEVDENRICVADATPVLEACWINHFRDRKDMRTVIREVCSPRGSRGCRRSEVIYLTPRDGAQGVAGSRGDL